MKLYESYKCKRQALGMTQKEFGDIVGVDAATISKFELGNEVSTPVFNSIRYGAENYIKSLDREKYIETRIIEAALGLEYQSTDTEKLIALNHMSIHISKLTLDILKSGEGL